MQLLVSESFIVEAYSIFVLGKSVLEFFFSQVMSNGLISDFYSPAPKLLFHFEN